jgi:hypothetical protein
MSEALTVELPDELALHVRALAAATNRAPETVILEWVERAAAEPAVEILPDSALLALCESSLEAESQSQLSELLARAGENDLDAAGRVRLDQLMTSYRRGLVLKARAWKEAGARGLKAPIAVDGA